MSSPHTHSSFPPLFQPEMLINSPDSHHSAIIGTFSVEIQQECFKYLFIYILMPSIYSTSPETLTTTHSQSAVLIIKLRKVAYPVTLCSDCPAKPVITGLLGDEQSKPWVKHVPVKLFHMCHSDLSCLGFVSWSCTSLPT